jgi:hypothetical protein
MANVKITELTALTAADSASTDVLPIVDVSADATKKLAISDLHRSVPDGTLSAPGIAFQSDLNSGLYRSGTDAIALVTNGAARIQVAATGNVTIPNNLTVQGTTTCAFAAGTEAAPSITFVNDSDTGLYSPGANQVAISTAGNEQLRIDSNGNLALGTASPNNYSNFTTLTINNTTGGEIDFESNGTLVSEINSQASNGLTLITRTAVPIRFGTAGTGNRLVITSTGNAEFAGQVKADSTSGAFQASRTDGGANHVFRGGTSTSSYTSVITANGQLTLSGANGAFQATRSDGGGNHIFRGGTSTSNYTTVITAAGAASFVNGVITLQSTGKIETVGNTSAVHIGLTLDSTKTPFNIYDTNNGNATIAKINGAGAAQFVSEVVAGVRDSQGVFITSGGAAESHVSGSRVWSLGSNGSATFENNVEINRNFTNETALEVKNNGSMVIDLRSNGSATFTGNVAIGDTNPDRKLQVINSTDALMRLGRSDASSHGSTDVEIKFSKNYYSNAVFEAASHRFEIQGTEKVRIDGDGRLLVGGTSTADNDHANINANGTLTIRRASSSDDCIVIKEGSTSSLLIEASGNVFNYNVGSFAYTSYDNEAGVAGPYAAFGSFNGEARISAGSTGSDDVPLVFRTASSGNLAERMKITSTGYSQFGGYLLSMSNHRLNGINNSQGTRILVVSGYQTSGGTSQDTAMFYAVNNGGSVSSQATGLRMYKNTGTNRSINAAGTINASGADYAEYMTKAGDFTLAKGDVCGINIEGKLTNVFADAISFVVKSTDPSYVGGDKWHTTVGEEPGGYEDTRTEEEIAAAKVIYEEAVEAARQLVDRIAFSGQVPVNVTGATPGQYIIPTAAADGSIEGTAKAEADLTMAEYMSSVGKVIAIESDGRAKIIVKVA